MATKNSSYLWWVGVWIGCLGLALVCAMGCAKKKPAENLSVQCQNLCEPNGGVKEVTLATMCYCNNGLRDTWFSK